MNQQVDQLVAELFRKVEVPTPVYVQPTAEDVIRDAEVEHCWQFRRLDYSGTLDEPFEDDEFTYCNFASLQDEYTLPNWADKRLKWTVQNFQIKQVIIGHEHENPLDSAEEVARRRAEAGKKAFRRLALAVVAIMGAVIVAGAMAALLAVASLVLIVAAAVSAPLTLLDPVVIVVLDNTEETWICIARYYE